MSEDLRVAVLGVGMMGADHVRRITDHIAGARVVVVNDYLTERAEQLAATIPGCRAMVDPFDAIAAEDVDAVVLATPGPTHEEQLLACLDRGVPVMCEKPLTTDVESALTVVRAEASTGNKLIQVGFMRRFDAEYEQLHALLSSGGLGTPLLMHCVHRNPTVPPRFDSAMIVKDSLVHEVDVTRFLFDEEITTVQIITPTPSPSAPAGLQDPQVAVFTTASGRHVDVEVFVSTGIAYEVRTEVVGDRGSAMIGLDNGLIRTSTQGTRSRTITPSFVERFGAAYDVEIQRWVAAVRGGAQSGVFIDGPGAWDGYAAAAVCAAGVESLSSGRPETVRMVARSDIAGA